MRRRRRRRALLAGAALFLAALGSTGAMVVAFYQEEAVAVLCSSVEEICDEWARGFTAESGVPVTMQRMSSGEALERLTRRRDVPEFDVWHGGPAESFVVADERGLLAPYTSPAAADVPARYKDPDGAWTGVYVGVLGFCSNTDVLDRLGVPTPRSWADLLDPRLRNRIAAPRPDTSGTGYTMLWVQARRLGTDDGLAYLRALDANVGQYTRSGTAPAGVAGRGEAAVGITFDQHCLTAADRGMDALVLSYPAEGTGHEVGAVAVVAGGPHPEGARRYVDYAVSRRAHEQGAATGVVQMSTRPDVADDPRLGTDPLVLRYTQKAAADDRIELTRRFRTEVDR